MLEQAIFLAVVQAPGEMEGASPGNDVRHPALRLEPLDGPERQAAMDRHEVHAFPGLLFDDAEQVVFGHGYDRSAAVDGGDAPVV